MDVQDRFAVIHSRLSRGLLPEVQAVDLGDGRYAVRWGVGDVTLDLEPVNAREVADAFEREAYQPELHRLLRLAADVCDEHQRRRP